MSDFGAKVITALSVYTYAVTYLPNVLECPGQS